MRGRAHERTVSDPQLPYGTNRCRCAGCGRYFGGADGFDRHRVNFRCLDPATMGLSLNMAGYWVRPAPRMAAVHGGRGKLADISAAPSTLLQRGVS